MPSDKRRTDEKKVSRRGFLGRAALLGAGALAMPAIIPASARGAGGFIAPSERLGLGFIGLGKMGGGHLHGFLGVGEVHIAAVCDVDSFKLKVFKEMVERNYTERYAGVAYKGCEAYKDFRELLSRPGIDAVVIGTPDHWHSITSIHAAKAGKDIYCEKPMAHTIREGRAVVEAVRRYGRVFQTGSQQRSEYGGMFRRAAELVRNGRVGKIEKIHVQVGGPGQPCHLPAQPVPEELDWNFWVGPAPWRPFNAELCPAYTVPGFPNWRGYSDFGGGGLFDFGAHHFDIAQWAMGMDDSGPVEIIPPDGKDVPLLTFKYANGVPMYHGGGNNDVEFVGSKGILRVGRGSIESEPDSILKEVLGPEEVHLDRGMCHRDDWMHCIKTRGKPIADVEIGHRTASVCSLGFIAYQLQRPLRWDPSAERFINDPEADRLLGYAMRSPWHI